MFTGATGLLAYAAVFVMVSVVFALVAAGFTSLDASLEKGAGDGGVVAGVPGQDAGGCGADIGTVEVGADALAQLGHRLFTEAGIGAGCTCLGTRHQRVDGVSQ